MGKLEPQNEVRGLKVVETWWGLGVPQLRVSLGEATFPMRCLFTNEPVESLTTMKIQEVRVRRSAVSALMIRDKFMSIDLPVSPQWLARRAQMKERIGRILLRIGIVGLVCAILVAILPNAVLAPQLKMPVGGIFGGIGILGLIVGFVWPRIESMEADPYTIPGYWGDDFLMITAPFLSKDFAASISGSQSE